MGSKKIAIILVTMLLAISAMRVFLTKDNKNINETSNTTYSENEEDTLVIETDAEINNSEDAYKTAILTKENFENANKDKIASQNIKEIHIVIKGKYKDWLYDGTGNVKEIDIE